LRLKLKIHPYHRHTSIPINYAYYLSSAIYRWIEKSSSELSKALHDGYPLNTSKSNSNNSGNLKHTYKFFCFSQLFPQSSTVKDRLIHIDGDAILWYIGMHIEDILKHFIIGIFEKQEFFIGSPENKFYVNQVEVIPDPEWKREMKFKALSPITVSVPCGAYGNSLSFQARYLKADDPELSSVLRKNILRRYEFLYGSIPEDNEFNVTLDEDYIKKRGGANGVSKLITIKEGLRDETKVRGFICPLTIQGNPELIKLAYDSGLGEKGSMGFGMLEVNK